jgi:hypothetical protein
MQVVAYRSLHVLEIAFALPVAVQINGAAGFQAQQARVEVIPLLLNVTTFMERTAAVDSALEIAPDSRKGRQQLGRARCTARNPEAFQL